MPPDEEAPVEEPQDKAPESGPEGITAESGQEDSPAEDIEQLRRDAKSFQDLRPEYTRTTQRVSQLEKLVYDAQQGDPEALSILGWQSAEEPEDDEDEIDDPDERLDRLEAYLQQEAEQRAFAQQAEQEHEFLIDGLADEFARLEGEIGRELDDEEFQFLARKVESPEDIATIWEEYDALLKADRDRYLGSKKAERVQATGTAGTEKVNLADEQERVKHMATLMEADDS